MSYIYSVERYPTLFGITIAGNTVQQACLSCAIWTNYGNQFSVMDSEIDFVQRSNATKLQGKCLHLQLDLPFFWSGGGEDTWFPAEGSHFMIVSHLVALHKFRVSRPKQGFFGTNSFGYIAKVPNRFWNPS